MYNVPWIDVGLSGIPQCFYSHLSLVRDVTGLLCTRRVGDIALRGRVLATTPLDRS